LGENQIRLPNGTEISGIFVKFDIADKCFGENQIRLQSDRNIWYFSWRYNYVKLLPETLICHKSDASERSGVRAFG
jgi:hypothetical protein